jgi:hypothetical protein
MPTSTAITATDSANGKPAAAAKKKKTKAEKEANLLKRMLGN